MSDTPYHRADRLIRQADPESIREGLRILSHETELRPGDALAWFERAGAYDFLGREEEALPHYERALEIGCEELPAQNRPQLFLQMGSTLRNLKRYDESRELLLHALLAADASIQDYARALHFYRDELHRFPEPPITLQARLTPGRFAGQVLEVHDNKAEICEKTLRSLPDWFGIEEAIVQYAKAVEDLPTWVVQMDGESAGFLSLRFHNAFTAEIHVMAVFRQYHRQGVGRALILAVEERAKTRGAEYLVVKTLGPSRPNEQYDQTRNFYLSTGFRPLEEFKTIWNEANPCLILVKAL